MVSCTRRHLHHLCTASDCSELSIWSSRISNLITKRAFELDNWCFLTELGKNRMTIKDDFGYEIEVSQMEGLVGPYLSHHAAKFDCTIQAFWYNKNWLTLATNKYGSPVAGVLMSPAKSGFGYVFIFPAICERPQFIAKLLCEVLPNLPPHLFPHFEGARWVQRLEYEIPVVQGLKHKIVAIQESTRAQIAEIEDHRAIERERQRLATYMT